MLTPMTLYAVGSSDFLSLPLDSGILFRQMFALHSLFWHLDRNLNLISSMVINSDDKDITSTLSFPLYYTGHYGVAFISEQGRIRLSLGLPLIEAIVLRFELILNLWELLGFWAIELLPGILMRLFSEIKTGANNFLLENFLVQVLCKYWCCVCTLVEHWCRWLWSILV